MRVFLVGGFASIALWTVAAAQPVPDADVPTIIAADEALKRGDSTTALKMMRPLADRGDARGESFLGAMYLTGKGVPLSYREGAKWYKLAADQGDAFAQDTVGSEYDRGRGFPKSTTDAVKYYRLSASQGNSGGQYSMCLMYYLGEVVQKDYIQAYMWCTLALAGSRDELREAEHHGLDRVAEKLSPAQIAEARRRAQAWRPVDMRKGKTMCANAACEVPGEGFLTP